MIKIIAPSNVVGRNGQSPPDCTYKFSRVFDESADQREVFDNTAFELVKDLVEGKDGLLFTYGVTGSGKTFTMTGTPRNEQDGILPRSLDVLFNSVPNRAEKRVFIPDAMNSYDIQSESQALYDRSRMNLDPKILRGKFEMRQRVADTRIVKGAMNDILYAVFISYIEIYQNFVYDLLEPTPNIENGDKSRPPLSKLIRHDTKNSVVYVENVCEVEVGSTAEAFEQFILVLNSQHNHSDNQLVVYQGQERRRIAHTMLNAESSRSHSIFNIKLVMAPVDVDGYEAVNDKNQLCVSQLSLVDLAGSEKNKRTENVGERLAESGKINQSLMTLRQCMDKLRMNQRSSTDRSIPIPYRDSKLTHLFKNYFDGRGKVRMIVCVNSHAADYEENLFVMGFAELAQELEINRASELKLPIADCPIGRRLFAQWEKGIEMALTTRSDGFPNPPTFSVFFDRVPSFHLNGPDDSDAISRFRHYFQTRARKHAEYTDAAIEKLPIVESKMHMALCMADDYERRLEEMGREKTEVELENGRVNAVLRQTRRELTSLKYRMNKYERDDQLQVDKEVQFKQKELEYRNKSRHNDVKWQQLRNVMGGSVKNTIGKFEEKVQNELGAKFGGSVEKITGATQYFPSELNRGRAGHRIQPKSSNNSNRRSKSATGRIADGGTIRSKARNVRTANRTNAAELQKTTEKLKTHNEINEPTYSIKETPVISTESIAFNYIDQHSENQISCTPKRRSDEKSPLRSVKRNKY